MIRPLISSAAGVLLAASLLFAGTARATPMSYGTGLANPAVTIDFAGLSDGATAGSMYASQGVTFLGLYGNSSQGNTLPPTTAPAAANFLGQTTNSVFSIGFAAVVSDAAFFIYTDGFGALIESSLNGVAVEAVNVGQYRTDGQDFFGFTGSAFDLITVTVFNTGNALIDDLQVGGGVVVPEPSSGIMVVGLVGLMALGGWRRGR